MADQPSTRRTDFGPLYLPNLIVALVASVGLIIGSIGPWATVFASSSFFARSWGGMDGDGRGGMDGDGIVTLIMGIAATAALFWVLNLGFIGGKPKLMTNLGNAAAIAGAIGAIVGITTIIDVRSRSVDIFGKTIRPEVGWGLWLVLISSVTLIATAIIVSVQARKKSDVD